jgi:acyl-CoA synthetase (AMP-forming)/AMP-acid ligase II
MRLENVIAQTMDSWPQRVAVVYKGRQWSYAALRELVDAVKRRLSEAGLSEGDRTILWMENSPEYIATYLAVLETGGVVVAIHPQVPVPEVVRIIRHVGATGLVASSSVKHWTIGDLDSTGLQFIVKDDQVISCSQREVVIKGPAGLAQIIYTSGSTGQPKGVMLTHRNLIANTRSILQYLHLTSEDSAMAVLPFMYAYGNSVMLTHLFVGGTLVIENSFLYPHVILESMMREGVTGLSGVSTTYAIMLNHSNLKSYSFPTLRYLTHAGGPMPSELLIRIRSVFSGKRIFLMYGQTEASARLTFLPPDLLDVKRGSAGRAIPGVALKILKEEGVEARIGEVGEVCASGDNIMQGYWQDPHATAEILRDGWLHTGDLGRLDGDGYLTLDGRNSEMIKSGAYRISPSEIEEVLLQHPHVQEAGVIGVDDPILGQKICAVVTLKEAGCATDQELLAHCAQRLVQYKRPKSVAVVTALPKSPSGKILRKNLREISLLSARSPATTTS